MTQSVEQHSSHASPPADVERRPLLAYVLHAGNLYGTERAGLATVHALDEYTRRVVLSPPGGIHAGSALEESERLGLESAEFTSRLSLLRHLRSLFAGNRQADVITTSITQSLLVVLAAWTTGCSVRHLHVVHGNGDATNFRWKPLLIPFRLRYLAVSTHVRDILQSCHVPERRILVVENVVGDVDTPQVRKAYVDTPPGDDGPIRLAVISRAEEVKRLNVLLDFAALPGSRDFHVDVYGGGSLLQDLRERSQAYPNLVFHGFVPNAADVIASADFLVHSCHVETFGLVVLEAHRAGIVPVVPDAGGTATIVEPGRTGFHYRGGDARDLVRALRSAASTPPEKLDDMVRLAEDHMRHRYSPRKQAASIRAAFLELGP